MKLLVALFALVALCYGTPISVIPGDNSHYVEGLSRYIWMPDGDGVPHLVDLYERPSEDEMQRASRNGANNQYWLYSRQNRNNYQLLIHNNANSVQNSNYRANRPTVVIVHGWNNNGNSEINPNLRDAFLQVLDCNVVVVDWRTLAGSSYFAAVSGVPSVGQHIGDFLTWLINTAGGNWNQVHLVGHSLGAHVVGNAGRRTGNRPRRITGLDPAGPSFANSNNALRATDGVYVECIHTDGGTLGIFNPICRANFYPNGGRNAQPGCWLSTCSHGRAHQFMESSIYNNHFVGRQCNNIQAAQNGNCNGATLNMGNAIMNKNGNGLFGLTTGGSWPF
ncbi:lipase domain-containing protein [Phthorimaea operculella]|nr:lipase domain-containing protein [Phthorimaea operculella]